MANKTGKPRKLAPGQLALICDECDGIVTRGSSFSEGYLTIESDKWRVYHDRCKSATGAVIVRESRIGSYPLLVSTVAQLATDRAALKQTNWPDFLRRIVADTEWYFDAEGGQMSVNDMVTENTRVLESIGMAGKKR